MDTDTVSNSDAHHICDQYHYYEKALASNEMDR